jgi:serine/threonine protein phosphatase PrpC
LENEQILNKIWSYKKLGQTFKDIHSLCSNITDAIIKYSMEKNSFDNVTVIFIAFKNFERKMKDRNFEYKYSTKCVEIPDSYDFSTI